MAAGYWSKEETFKLITIWSDDTIQAQLEGCRRNSDVYRKTAKELTEAGHNRTQLAIVAAFSWRGLIVTVMFVAFSGWFYGLGLCAQRTLLLYTTALASERPSYND